MSVFLSNLSSPPLLFFFLGVAAVLVRSDLEIPAVRPSLRQIDTSWPHWAYFYNPVDDSIKLLLSCVAGTRFLGRGAVEMDADLVAAALARGGAGRNVIFDRFGLTEVR